MHVLILLVLDTDQGAPTSYKTTLVKVLCGIKKYRTTELTCTDCKAGLYAGPMFCIYSTKINLHIRLASLCGKESISRNVSYIYIYIHTFLFISGLPKYFLETLLIVNNNTTEFNNILPLKFFYETVLIGILPEINISSTTIIIISHSPLPTHLKCYHKCSMARTSSSYCCMIIIIFGLNLLIYVPVYFTILFV